MADAITLYDPSTEYIDPDGDGATSDWTSFGTGTSKADRVADGTTPPTAPDTTDGITTGSAGNVQNLTFPNPTGAWNHTFSVTEVILHMYARQSESVSRDRSFDLELTIGGTIWSGNIDTNSATYAWHSWQAYDGLSSLIGEDINSSSTFNLDITSFASGGGPAGDWDIAAIRLEIRIDRDHVWFPLNNHQSSTSPSNAQYPDDAVARIGFLLGNTHIGFGPNKGTTDNAWPIGKVELVTQYAFNDAGNDDGGSVVKALYANAVRVGPDFPLTYSETKAEEFEDVTRYRSWQWADFDGVLTGVILDYSNPGPTIGDSCDLDFVGLVVHADDQLDGPLDARRGGSDVI